MELEPVTVNKVRSKQPWVRSKDYVRCFCNLPQCIRTGYMCKSIQGGCFSDFSDHFNNAHQSKDYRATHGCLESINREQQHKCELNPDGKQTSDKSLFFCCYHDMCNHVDSPQTKTIINNTLMSEEPIENPIQDHHRRPQHPPHLNYDSIGDPLDYTNSQVWFRAATIAVPVCGAVILFVLIALAVKILRNENQHGNANRKLGPGYEMDDGYCKPNRTYENLLRKNPYQGEKVIQAEDVQRIQMPLLIQNEILSHLNSSASCHHHPNGNKNETNAKYYNFINNAASNPNQEQVSNVILDIEAKNAKICADNNINLVGGDESKIVFIKQFNSN